MVLHPLAPGEAAVFAPDAPDLLRPDPLVRDLSTAGVTLRYARSALGVGGEVLLGRGAAWPVVVRTGRVVHFLPDPVSGAPSPADAPLWPLFVDDLARVVHGRAAGSAPGWRVTGLLDPDASALGRRASPFDTGTLADVPPDRAPDRIPLRVPLALAALLALAGLWIAPALRVGERRRFVPRTD